jgi:hypothetical protein
VAALSRERFADAARRGTAKASTMWDTHAQLWLWNLRAYMLKRNDLGGFRWLLVIAD